MRVIVLAAAAALALGTSAFAQTTTTTTVVTEQPAARIVEVPATVRTYVTQQSMPDVVLEGPVEVGRALPDTVHYQVVPDNDGYAYAVVNGRKVLIDPSTRSVIEVYD